jgi:nucleotide-binding universal stress UspA family protein
MRALVWIEEHSWESCVDRARELIPNGAEVTLLHVAATGVEELVAHPGPGWLGRRREPPAPPIRAISEAEAHALLDAALERLARPAQLLARRGQVEREVVGATNAADLLVLARDGDTNPGPASLGRRSRFIVDHAACDVVLVWPEAASPAAPRVRGPDW